jgi:hypothetical protein
MFGECLFLFLLTCVSLFEMVKSFFFFLLENIMWIISKSQIYASHLQSYVLNLFKNNDNDFIRVDFIKSGKSYAHLKFVLESSSKIKKVSWDHTEYVFNEESILSENNHTIVEKIISENIPKDFEYYIISNSYNTHYRIELLWKGLNNLFEEYKEVSFMFSPILLEITYPDIEPIQFLLTTKQYNYLVVGNVLDKLFFQYFFQKYYSDKVSNKVLDTYQLLVIDYACKRHIYTEKDVFTITQTKESDKELGEIVKYHIFH